jgi:hypothetical protein
MHLGFVTGERTFSPHFKSHQYLLLHALPITRAATWFALISGRLAAGLLSFSALFIFGTVMVSKLWDGNSGFLSIGTKSIGMRIFLFMAGTCGALLFRRTILVYLGSVPALSLLYIQTYGFSQSYHMAASSYFVIILILANCSCFLFCSGEWGLARQRARNALKVCTTLITCLGCAVISNLLLFRSQHSWLDDIDQPIRSTESPRQRVSPSGRYLIMLDYYQGYISRLRVIDTMTSRVVGTWTGTWLLSAGWSGQDDSLFLVRIKGRWFDLSGVLFRNLTLIRYSPSLNKIETLSSNDFSATYPWTLGIDSYGTRGRIVAVGTQGGEHYWALKGSRAQELSVAATAQAPLHAPTRPRALTPSVGPSGEKWLGQYLGPVEDRPLGFASYFGEDLVYSIAKSDRQSTILVYRPKAAGWKVLTGGLPANLLSRRQSPTRAGLHRKEILQKSPRFHASVIA